METFQLLIYALVLGVFPALVWLFFWLKEDSYHPEPLGRIIKTFLGGALAVLFVIPLEQTAGAFFPGLTFITFLLWAIIE